MGAGSRGRKELGSREIRSYCFDMRSEFAPLFQLDRAERLQLVEDLWDSIAQEDLSDLPVPDWKRDELRRRKARFLQHPEAGLGDC